VGSDNTIRLKEVERILLIEALHECIFDLGLVFEISTRENERVIGKIFYFEGHFLSGRAVSNGIQNAITPLGVCGQPGVFQEVDMGKRRGGICGRPCGIWKREAVFYS